MALGLCGLVKQLYRRRWSFRRQNFGAARHFFLATALIMTSKWCAVGFTNHSGPQTEAPYKLRTGDTSWDLPRSGRSKFLIDIILLRSLCEWHKRSSFSRYGIEPSRGPWWGTVPVHIPEVWYRRNGGKSPNQNVRAPQRARGNVRAHRQNGPPCDPRASPDHPTW